MDIDSLIQIYRSQGWNDDAAIRADIAAGGWQGKVGGNGGGSGVDSILSNSINSITSSLNVPKPYESVAPFNFDEALARKAATAEYEPYYKRTLEDYTQSVERKKSRSAEDLQSTLKFLAGGKEYFTGANRRVLDKALRQSAEGYEGRGLYLSGANKRDLEEIKTENQASVSEYERGLEEQQRTAKLTDKRTIEDVDYEKAQTTRNLAEEQKFAIESGVLKRRGEYQTTYEQGRKKYYSGLGYIV